MPIGRLTHRDLDLLTALDRAPHTAPQLLRLSGTFVEPFSAERLVRRRLQQLAAAGLVRRALLSGLAGRGGAPNVYLLSPLGYRVLYGPDAAPPGKRYGKPPSVLRHRHTHALTDALVHLYGGARRAGVSVAGFCRENAVRLVDGSDSTYPDAAFQLIRPGGTAFSYFVELDAGTERLLSAKEDSWERKLRIYEAVRITTAVPFRLIVLALGSAARATHIQELARRWTQNPRRSLVYAAPLRAFLDDPDPLTSPLFRDHLGRSASLLPAVGVPAASALS